MHIRHNLADRGTELYFTGTHVELNCSFQNSSGDTVLVTNPSVQFSPKAPSVILSPFSQNHDIPNQYTVKFLTDSMDPGSYTITGSGMWNGQSLSVSGQFEIYTLSRIQSFIELLRSLLKDRIPELYIVRMPSIDTFKWDDGELYTCLLQALRAMNGTPPTNIIWPDIQSVPIAFEGHLVQIAVIWALSQRQMLEIQNVINYSDEISFNIDRSAKYMSAAQMQAQLWWQAWVAAKKDLAFRSIQHAGIISNRYPLHFIRPLSMLPNSQNTFGWF